MKKSILLFVSLLFFFTQCHLFQQPEQEDILMPTPRSWSQILASDTLSVVTIQDCYTAFQYKNNWYGHDYEIARRIADSLGIKLHIMYVNSEHAMCDSLYNGSADLAIWPASKSVVDSVSWVLPTGPRWKSSQVMVSARRLKPIAPDDTVTHYKLSLLLQSRQWIAYHDDSVRVSFDFTPFVLDTIPADSLTTPQLCDALIEGRTDMVMLRTNVARLLKDYYPTLRLSEPLSHSADSVSWLIAMGADTLRMYIDSLCKDCVEEPHYDVSLKRLYEQQRGRHVSRINYKLRDGALSPYDAIFRKHAHNIGWDWRLLAAIGFVESKLDHTQISTRGPIGLMQLMPATVRAFGYTEEEVVDPDLNVEVACVLIGKILESLRNKLTDVNERDLIQFTLAGYNAGLGHVFDAIYLADTLGYEINVWPNNVEHCLRLKADPNYYSYPKVRLGRFNGAFTINYISQVLAVYDEFCSKVPLE